MCTAKHPTINGFHFRCVALPIAGNRALDKKTHGASQFILSFKSSTYPISVREFSHVIARFSRGTEHDIFDGRNSRQKNLAASRYDTRTSFLYELTRVSFLYGFLVRLSWAYLKLLYFIQSRLKYRNETLIAIICRHGNISYQKAVLFRPQMHR